MLKRLIRRPAVQAALAWLLGLYLQLALRTTRWTLLGEGPALAIAATGRPLVVAFWHERLPMMPALFRAAQRLLPQRPGMRPHVLVSRHRDGRFIGEVVKGFGLAMVHGSTSRGGVAGMLELLRVLRHGDPVGITPDGPRGPRRVAAPGVAEIAALSGAPVLACAAATTNARILPSWDRMLLPLPFGRGVLVLADPLEVPRDGGEEALPVIAATMTECCDRADAWVEAQRRRRGASAEVTG
jgi:lysophospholipid acyltransferase (LPLAT)-like uncharacterized protein